MATNTKNFNFKKPDESDFYSIQDQNGNWDLADEELQKLNEPAFEDYTTGTSVPPAATALEALKSKIKLPVWMSNVVAFCKGCCTLAMIVNNCVSSDADKPLAAAQGKVLQDQVTKLYSDMSKFDIYHRDVTGNLNEDETIQNALEDFKNTVVSNKPILVEIQNHSGGRALAVGIQSGINYNSFLVITYYDRPKEFVYAGNHWQAWRVISTLGMEYGTTDMNRTPGQVTTKHITFQNRLSAFPKVFVCPHTKSPDDTTVSASEATYDGFDIYCYSKAAKEPLAISWMAWY